MQQRLERVHGQVGRCRTRQIERNGLAGHDDCLTVSKGNRVGDAAGDAVDAARREGLLGGVGLGVGDSGQRPIDVALRPQLLDGAQLGLRVLHDLGGQVAADVLAAAVDGCGRADTRRWSHHRHMRGEGDERPGAGGATARRADPDDHRQRRIQQGLDDVVGRCQCAAGRVELDHDRGEAVCLRLGDAVVEVALHDLIDDAVRRHDVNPWRGPQRERRRSQSERQTRGESQSSEPVQP